jgi:hypothetical protein
MPDRTSRTASAFASAENVRLARLIFGAFSRLLIEHSCASSRHLGCPSAGGRLKIEDARIANTVFEETDRDVNTVEPIQLHGEL